ncbi:Ppx/GppA phosphatase [Hippea maritima]|uniref:Ppx/GppA phosphatase n=1 Tax=Hippea maritima (strain ATCC 700847 / DSM 10411 / MH2) TaxID=760142 RepID=F2LVT2_HIPMA|nr:Ppx/GppA phosphatase [Hippea maritima]AEA33866.1 Ppx/GppA phosphatase [Hippea maritima DSM 10411]
MVIASIDIGTNTVRLLIARKKGPCTFEFLLQKSRIARLGEGFLPQKILKPQAIQRTLEILKEYLRLIVDFNVDKTVAVATSATREALNKDELLKEAEKLGLNIRVIDGDEEAELTHLGIMYFLNGRVKGKRWAAFDLGGGSTEFMFSCGKNLKEAFSLPIGVVKLLEKHIKEDPPQEGELVKAGDDFIGILHERIKAKDNIDFIVANAGTTTTLAAIDLKLVNYDYRAVEGYILKKSVIESILKNMVKMDSKHRLMRYSILEKGREDVIVVGAYILKRVLEFFGKDYLIATNGSLREGVIIKEFCSG